MTETTEKISRAVKGEFALGLQRIFIIAGLPILIGVGGFLGVRAVTSVDELAKRLDNRFDQLHNAQTDQSTAIGILQNTMKLRGSARNEQIRSINSQMADHENRIRFLERPGGLAGPR